MAIENRNLEAGTLAGRLQAQEPVGGGCKVMGGKAVSGWRFWTLEGEEPQAKPEKAPKGKKSKLFYKAPNQ